MLKPSFFFPVVAAQPHTWSIGGKNGTLVTVDLDTGETTFGEHYTPDEAARNPTSQLWARRSNLNIELEPFSPVSVQRWRIEPMRDWRKGNLNEVRCSGYGGHSCNGSGYQLCARSRRRGLWRSRRGLGCRRRGLWRGRNVRHWKGGHWQGDRSALAKVW
jgi:hypothetical protein